MVTLVSPALIMNDQTTHLFKSSLLGFWHEQEYHEERGDVETGIKSESSDFSKRFKNFREGDREHCSPEETCCNCETHANFTVREWENLCGVGERNRPFAGRIKSGEEEYEECNKAKVSFAILRNVKTETCCEEGPGLSNF